MADAHLTFLFELLVAHLNDLQQKNRAETVCACMKIHNFEPLSSTDHDYVKRKGSV